jgi:hypothetical protein
MKTKRKAVAIVFVLVFTLPLVLAPISTRGVEIPKAISVSERVQTELQALFQKYYPKAKFTNQEVNGLRFEYDVTTFEFPYAGPKGAKHENPIQRGPKKGGILCNVFSREGSYTGPIAFPSLDGQIPQYTLDRKVYKTLLMAPYSAKRDAHLWVALSYPPDASEDFLKQFHAIINDFEKDAD